MTAYADAIATRVMPRLTLVLEIEGLGTAYSSRAVPSGWYTGGTPRLAAKDRPASVVSCFRTDGQGTLATPNLSDASLDFFGGRSSMGTLELQLVDRDDSLVALTGLRRHADVFVLDSFDEDETEIRVYGPDIATLEDYVNGYLHIGRETVKLTAYTHVDAVDYVDIEHAVLTIERAQYHSRALPHFGKQTPDGATRSAEGDQVSWFPRHLVDRKVWLRVGYDAANDSECISAFVGTIRSFAWTDLGRTLKLTCEDFQTLMKRPIFTDLSSRWQWTGGDGHGPRFKFVGTREGSLRGIPPNASMPSESATAVSVGDWPEFPVGGRLMGVVGSGDKTHVVMLERIAQSTPSYGQTINFQVKSVPEFIAEPTEYFFTNTTVAFRPLIMVAAGNRGPGESDVAAELVWPDDPVDGHATDHVLAILLAVLTSTGTGGNGDWDHLPQREWGLAIPEDEIDVDGIVALMARYPRQRVRVPVLEPVPDAREWLIQLLRPFGYAMCVKSDGRLGVATIRGPRGSETAAAPTLTFSHIAIDSKSGQPMQYEGPGADGEQRVVGVHWKDSPYLKDGKLALGLEFTAWLSPELDALATAGDVQPLEVECAGLSSWNEDRNGSDDLASDGRSSRNGLSWFRRQDLTAGRDVAQDLLRALQVRYSGTPSLYSLDVTLRRSTVSVGDWLAVTLPALPNPFNGQRGLTSLIAQVVRRKVNLLRGTISLDLSITDVGNEDIRTLAPALEVNAAWEAAGSMIATVAQHAFSRSPYNDTAAFVDGVDTVGYDVRVYSADHLYCSQKVRINAKDATHVTLSATPVLVSQVDGSPRGTTDPIAGDLIELADWGEQGSALARNRFSYMTGPDGFLTNLDGTKSSTKSRYH